jgi:hypothetical protein
MRFLLVPIILAAIGLASAASDSASSPARRHAAIEINPFSLLTLVSQAQPLGMPKQVYLSGGLSWYGPLANGELAFPFEYRRYYDSYAGGEETLTANVSYKTYIRGNQEGPYLAGFLRYWSESVVESETRRIDDMILDVPARHARIRYGLGYSLGYRWIARNHLTWGWNFSMGYYFFGPNRLRVFNETLPHALADLEFLKVGYVF